MRKKGYDPDDKDDKKKGFGLWNKAKVYEWKKLSSADQAIYLDKIERWKSGDLTKEEVRE